MLACAPRMDAQEAKTNDLVKIIFALAKKNLKGCPSAQEDLEEPLYTTKWSKHRARLV